MGAKQVRARAAAGDHRPVHVVHSECLKQIELNRDILRQIDEGDAKKQEEGQGGRYKPAGNQVDVEELERQVRGEVGVKRQAC